MKVALDAMGGDFSPMEAVNGAVMALNEMSHLEIILVGDKTLIDEELKKHNYDKSRLSIEHTDETIEMHEKMSPAMAVRKKPKASMNIAIDCVTQGRAHAIVSAGNTGALMTSSQMKLRRIKGVLRPAITTIFPSKHGHLVMLDAGANADCKPEFLNQFALMSKVYANVLLDIKNPKIGLLNIGEEEGKGNEITKEAYTLMKENDRINFVGNMEPRDMMEGEVDIVVTDGFTGNIVLKTGEGVVKFVFDFLKQEIKSSFVLKIGALLLKPVFKRMKEKMDSSEYGGALFLGLNGISIKAHGNSDGKAFKNAIKVAEKFAEADLTAKLKKVIDKEA
ncbi:phosphate acyltransferase PlsX [Ilyobacter polytropus]|uniref:Phosphate acyltransferase n=1 Tax=Ilyobacter polytropus (strain ATCC 51220 / DSM 2926 / LMG 16218 / CuHBu1) TaxID=572544 RepID=E3H861_ILYPC|nr:phosphate acyltransferase PlsX [Ilyobacter polytropus]ADO83292.1 phosphate:acyl-(acyl carrier protein) acyltransferase [Ilyobacter polytropus DSM 2926]